MSNADYQIFEDIIQEMMMVYRHDNRPWLIGYSGGKDSTLLVSLVFRAVSRIPENERNKKVYVITSDTMVENPSLSKLLIVTIVDSKSILITIAPNIFWLIISIGQNALESN